MSVKTPDVLIAGGGIGGLVAAAALVGFGLSVVLVEKNRKAGGSCSSFSRKGHTFDTGTSSLSGLGERGRLRKIFNDLGLSLGFLRPVVRETVIGPRFAVPAARSESPGGPTRECPSRKRHNLRRHPERVRPLS